MRKDQRFRFILLVLGCLVVATALALYALRDNISYFFTPTEVKELAAKHDPRVAPGGVFRLGGLVKEKTLTKPNDDAIIFFTVTDNVTEQQVQYQGITPDLFREGQGVVAKGSLGRAHIFIATELLAKHDEKYTPPELAKKMKAAHKKGTGDKGKKTK